MDKILEKSKELKKELEALPLFQEYKKVKELYYSSKEIKELEKEVIRSKNENRMSDHKLLLEKLHNHPLYINYHLLEEEVSNYLKEVTDLINR